MLFKRIKDWATSITAFRTCDVIPVDGPDGTAKMSKDDLLRVTAENALGSIHSLSDTATEADLVAGNYFAIDGSAGTKKLSANMYALKSEISKNFGRIPQVVYDVDKIPRTRWFINGSNYWGYSQDDGARSILLDVKKYRGQKFVVFAGERNSYFAFVKIPPVANASVQFSSYEPAQIIVSARTYILKEIPADANYVYVYVSSNSIIYAPDSIAILPSGTVNEVDYVKIIDVSQYAVAGAISNNVYIEHVTFNYSCCMIDCSAVRGKFIEITANDSNQCLFTFTTNYFSSGVAVTYATGYFNSNCNVQAGKSRVVKVPDDANYLYVYRNSGYTDYSPKSVKILDSYDGHNVDLSLYGSLGGNVNSSGKWSSNSNYYGILVPLQDYVGSNVTIEAQKDKICVYTFVSEPPSFGNDVVVPNGGYWTGLTIPAGSFVNVEIPAGAVYLYLYSKSLSVNYLPSRVTINNYEIDPMELNSSVVRRGMTKDQLRIATFNIGHFSNGVNKNSTITSADYNEKLAAFKNRIYTQVDPDVLGINEHSSIFGNDGTANKKTRDVLLNRLGIYDEFVQRNYGCLAICSNNCVENIKMCNYDCLRDAVITHTSAVTAQDGYYIESDLYIKGVRVKYVIVHFVFDANRLMTLQTAQMAEIVSKFGDEERCIIAGDFNAFEFADLFAPLVAKGFVSTNDGSLHTYPDGYQGYYSIDNILVKGLDCTAAQMVDCVGLSDHNMIYTDVTI